MRRQVSRMRQEFLEKKQHEAVHDAIFLRKQQFREALMNNTPLPGHLKKDSLLLKKFTELDDVVTGHFDPKNGGSNNNTSLMKDNSGGGIGSNKNIENNKIGFGVKIARDGKNGNINSSSGSGSGSSSKVIDDEYALAGSSDPKVLITTSRSPSQKLLEFTKEMRLVIPNAERLNRGNISVQQLMESARRGNFTDVMMIQEVRGVPDSLTVSHLPLGPTVVFTLYNVVTRHEISAELSSASGKNKSGEKDRSPLGPMSEQYPHLIFENFSTKLGKRVSDVLKYLFPIPKLDSTRVITFDNNNDFISFRHHTFTKKTKGSVNRGDNTVVTNISSSTGAKINSNVTLIEAGPRFELVPFRILLGTLEMADAEVEWVLRPYMNTAKKRQLL